MKQKGCSLLAYGEQRDKELYDAYRIELPLHVRGDGTIDNMAAVEAAVMKPCSRFWISEEIAATNIRKFKANPKLLESMIETKRAMYRELMDVYDRLRSDPTNNDLTDKQVAYLASDMPATRFYMTPGSAVVRICAERKKRLRSEGKKITAKHVIEDALKGNVKTEKKKEEPTKKRVLPRWTEFKPRPLNWHIKKRVRTAIQYVIRWGNAFDDK